ncbi:MAG: hypothetical protein LBE17_02205 [Treponema sp.]|jgi:hypothetical protein|nr:hypothetical protein [Treponema sp.]
MQKIKTVAILAFGLVAVLLAGCFSPVEVASGREEKPVALDNQPFPVSIYYGSEAARAAVPAGATAANIRNGLYNFMQLVVVDEKGGILDVQEKRQVKSSDSHVVFYIQELPKGSVNFLLLMGYWDRDFGKETTDGGVTTYAYNTGVNPVLLASGFQTADVPTEDRKVTITMWPIVTYAEFTRDPQGNPVKFESGVKPELAPGVAWKLDWAISKNGGMEKNGLEPLITAQQALPGVSESTLLVRGKKNVVDGAAAQTGGTTTDYRFSLDPGPANEVHHIGKPHWVNFNLEYVPFNLASPSVWLPYNNTSFFDLSTGAPVWVIRNGLNDRPQDENTTFVPDALGAGKNGNGGVLASVKAVSGWDGDNNKDGCPDNPEPNPDVPKLPNWAENTDLLLYDGSYHGPKENKAFITFRTHGYAGSVEIFYAVVKKGTYGANNFVPYGEFTRSLTNAVDGTGTFKAGDLCASLVSIPDANYPYTGNEQIWEVWLVFSADGKVSNRIAIEISKTNIIPSGIGIHPVWGGDDETTP